MSGPMWRRASVVAGIVLAATWPATADARSGPGPLPGAVVLPGDATAAATPKAPDRWIVGARPGRRAAAIGRRFGARRIVAHTNTFAVPTARARPLAAALRRAGLLSYAEPNVIVERRAMPMDPLSSHPAAWWNPAVVDPSLTPPPVRPDSKLIAVVDSVVDASHPELAGHTEVVDQGAPGNHGTAVASVASASANNVGFVGIWPGARILSTFNGGDRTTCVDAAAAVSRAAARRPAVINMSYGGTTSCRTHEVATQRAFGAGAMLVAAAGNEFREGNPVSYPAASPHVMAVAAINPDFSSSSFSNENSAVAISAPGTNILAAVPGGFTALNGTSFAAPMVSGAAAWIREVRPNLTAGQVAEVLTDGARDLGQPGWDRRFGWGLLNLAASLNAPTPPFDPLEPNDDIEWIDGTHFVRDRAINGNGRSTSFTASLDFPTDPLDVYRVTVPARRSYLITARPRFGRLVLAAYDSRARSVTQTQFVVGRYGSTGKASTVRLTNRGRKARSFWLSLAPARGGSLNPPYTLSGRLLRRYPATAERH
jgi:subtilisin family serine protease